MYAQLTIVGNVGQDPEMRFTPSGLPVSNFSVAVNRTWTNAAGEKQEQVTWFQVQSFNDSIHRRDDLQLSELLFDRLQGELSGVASCSSSSWSI